MKYLVILLCLLFITLEYRVGNFYQQEELTAFKEKMGGFTADDYYKAPPGTLPYAVKPQGVKRIIYLSNSHAKTGGNVANHLQEFLSQSTEDQYEVLDMSEPGIFAPEMLERFCASLSFQPDTLILAPAYISFSDRMILKRQSHSARSFFRPEVRSCLPAGFWLRNYDIGLYTDTLFSHYSKLYRYRDRSRKLIEAPLKKLFGYLSPDRPVHLLEADTNKSWQFPDGFDRNLFDWSLYASGRSSQLRDFAAILQKARKHSIETLITNLPIDWQKEPRERNTRDFKHYLSSLSEIAKGANHYINYEESFPKEFSTYDALHPTYHGARLHAYDLYLRLLDKNARALSELTTKDLKPYLQSAKDCSTSTLPAFIRYDIFEHRNAQQLLCGIQNAPLHSPLEAKLLNNLARRILYWQKTLFPEHITPQNARPELWQPAIEFEFKYAAENLAHFTDALTAIIHTKYRATPATLPEKEFQIEKKSFDITRENTKISLTHRKYLFGPRTIETVERSSDQKVFAVKVSALAGHPAYTKYDILGDRSFLLTDLNTSKLSIPEWVYSGIIVPNWGA